MKDSQYANSVTIEIIDLLDKDAGDGYWHKWFDNINSNKPNIFLNRLKGKERAHTYKFMKASPEKKEKVAELVDDPDFEIIINKAREYMQNERNKKMRQWKLMTFRMVKTLSFVTMTTSYIT